MGKKSTGGSQLAQLKAQLHSTGLTGPASFSSSSSKGKGSSSSNAKESNEAASNRRKAKLARINDQFASAFDVKLSKSKHDVLGKKPASASSSKTKGATGRPASAKSGGQAAREATLLPELLARHRSGTFVDRRFGEGDASLDPEAKALERFMRERQREREALPLPSGSTSGGAGGAGRRKGKDSLFSLNDGEEEGLTHYGQRLSALDDDDEDTLLGLGNFGDDAEGLNEAPPSPLAGGDSSDQSDAEEGGPRRERSRAEIMAEVMLKSKNAKAARQQQKEDDDDVRRALDDGLDDDLRMMLMGVPSALPSSSNSAKSKTAGGAAALVAGGPGPGAAEAKGIALGEEGMRATLVGGRKYEAERQLLERERARAGPAPPQPASAAAATPSVGSAAAAGDESMNAGDTTMGEGDVSLAQSKSNSNSNVDTSNLTPGAAALIAAATGLSTPAATASASAAAAAAADGTPTKPGNSSGGPAAPRTTATKSGAAAASTAAKSYDASLRELAFERRAQPSDRLKTEAELIAASAAQLRASERERVRRMRGAGSDSDDAEGAEDGETPGGKRKRKGKGGAAERRRAKRRVPGGDDLEDDFQLEGMTAGEAYGLGKGLGAAADDDDDNEGEESEEEDDESEEDEESGEEGAALPSDMEADSVSGSEEEESEDDDDDEEADEHNYNDLADLDGMQQPGEEFDSDEEAVAGKASEALVPQKKPKQKKSAKAAAAAAGEPKEKNKKKEGTALPSGSTLPFTFACPTTHDELLDILDEHEVAPRDVPVVIKRIRTLYHASLAEENKHKLQAFLHVLIDHFLATAGEAQALVADSPSSAGGEEDEEGLKERIGLLNTLVPHIFELSKTYTATATQLFLRKLALMQRNLTRGLAAQADASRSASARTWPGFAELSLFRCCGLVWPTSDRQHAVSTPLLILCAQYLAHCRVRPASAVADLASGLYLTTLVASFERESKRLVPEAMNFLFHAIALLAPADKTARNETIPALAAEYGIPVPDLHVAGMGAARLTIRKASAANGGVPPVAPSAPHADEAEAEAEAGLLSLLAVRTPEATTSAHKAQLLLKAVGLVEVFAAQYSGSEGFPEMFAPFARQLALAQPKLARADEPAVLALQRKVAAFLPSLEKRIAFARQARRALRLQAHRALSIASYVPKFEQSGYNPRARFDPDAERAEHAKLRALLKKERKGAVRELRRDAQFIAQVRDTQRQEEDKTYKRKMDKIMSEIQSER